MALLTATLVLTLGVRRFLSVQKRSVSLAYYRTYDEGAGEPKSLRQHSRHVQNHFEIPPLFHLAVLATFLAGTVDRTALVAAWLFVALRCLHSVIHLTYNDVTHRFFAYGFGVVTVLFLWGRLLVTLVSATSP